MDDNDWADLAVLADPATLEQVRAALGANVEKFDLRWQRLWQLRDDPVGAEPYAENVLNYLSNWLPAWRNEHGTRLVLAVAQEPDIAARVLRLLFGAEDRSARAWSRSALPPSALSLSAPDRVAALQERIRRWLLAYPAFVASDLAVVWQKPGPLPLIRLPRPDDTLQYPSFQFTDDRAPIAIVLQVNEVLGADGDPWGAAGWWFGSSLWFPDPPARMLGVVPDDRLLTAAHAALDGGW